PPVAIICAVSSSPSALTSSRATRAPSRAKRTAVALPMPLAAPVTMATFPSRRFIGYSTRKGARARHVAPPRAEMSGVFFLAGLQPQVNRRGDFWRLVREFDTPSFAGGLVSGIDDFQDFQSVLACFKRLFLAQNDIDEVLHFLGEAVIPFLFKAGEGPALRC